MAARMPYFVWSHAGRTAGDAAITMSPAASASFPKYRSIDGFGQSLAKHSSAAAATWVCNRGAAGLEAVDRFIIPSGHNLAVGGAQSIYVASDDNGSFTSPTTLGSIVSVAGLMEGSLTSSTEQYLQVSIYNNANAWEYGEIWLGRTRTPSAAVKLDPGWDIAPLVNTNVQRYPSGVQGSIINGPDQRTLRMTFYWVTGADLTLFQELAAACGGAKSPLWVGAPDDAIPTTLMWLVAISAWKQDAEKPLSMGASYTIQLELLEALG